MGNVCFLAVLSPRRVFKVVVQTTADERSKVSETEAAVYLDENNNEDLEDSHRDQPAEQVADMYEERTEEASKSQR